MLTIAMNDFGIGYKLAWAIVTEICPWIMCYSAVATSYGAYENPFTLTAVSIGGGIDLEMKAGRKRKRNRCTINNVTRGNICAYNEHYARR